MKSNGDKKKMCAREIMVEEMSSIALDRKVLYDVNKVNYNVIIIIIVVIIMLPSLHKPINIINLKGIL